MVLSALNPGPSNNNSTYNYCADLNIRIQEFVKDKTICL